MIWLRARVLSYVALVCVVAAFVVGCSKSDGDDDDDVRLISIAIEPADTQVAINTSQQFTATGTYSDDSTDDLTNVVTWRSSDNRIATFGDVDDLAVAEQGEIHGVARGTVTVTAELEDITGETTIEVVDTGLRRIVVTPPKANIARGTKIQFAAVGFYENGTKKDLTEAVVWIPSDSDAVSIGNAPGSRGLATANGTATVTIMASYLSYEGEAELNVTSASLTEIEITPLDSAIAFDTQQWFAATGHYSDGTTQDLTHSVLWSSSDEDVATISEAGGLASGHAPGNSTITAELGLDSANTTLTVTGADIASFAITPSRARIPQDRNRQFRSVGIFSDGTNQELTRQSNWESSNQSVATIGDVSAAKGLADPVAAGSTTLSALFPGASATAGLTVTAAELAAIEVTPQLGAVPQGLTQQFTATGIYSDGSIHDLTADVLWSSSDDERLLVDNALGREGLGYAFGAGGITVQAQWGAFTATAGFTVTAATLDMLAINPLDPTLPPELAQRFTATGTFSDASTHDLTEVVNWTTSDPSVASVSNAAGLEGQVVTHAAGTATITATRGTVSANSNVTVSGATLTSIAVTPATPTLPVGLTQAFTATATYSDASTQDVTELVTWTSSAAAVATISNLGGSRGVAFGDGAGSSTITASLNGISGSTSLTVTGATLLSITVAPVDPSVAAGTTLALSATGDYSDATSFDLTEFVLWSSDDDAIASVSNAAGSAGLAAAHAAGTATISAALSGVSGATDMTVTP